MENVTFLTTMAALSAATQTFVEHIIKKSWNWLEHAKEGSPDNLRHVAIHLVAFVMGAALAWSVELKPLTYLGLSGSVPGNALAAGVLVSFGGSFFDEALVPPSLRIAMEASASHGPGNRFANYSHCTRGHCIGNQAAHYHGPAAPNPASVGRVSGRSLPWRAPHTAFQRRAEQFVPQIA